MKILVPPGAGDAYWVLVKLRAFMERNGITEKPELWATRHCGDPYAERAKEYINRTGIARFGGCVDFGPGEYAPVFAGALVEGKSIWRGVNGCDYFIAYNGVLNNGGTLEGVDDLACEWDIPLPETPEEQAYGEAFAADGDYICLYVADFGTYGSFVEGVPIDKLVAALKQLPYRVVLVGAAWDQPIDDGLVDMVGKTTLMEAFSIIRRAKAFIGFQSGLNVISPTLGVPTLVFWDERYPEKTRTAVVAPQKVGHGYDVVLTTGEDPISEAMQLLPVMIAGGGTGNVDLRVRGTEPFVIHQAVPWDGDRKVMGKVLITGTSRGLGKYLVDQFSVDWEVVAHTRSEWGDIRSEECRNRIAAEVADCNVFINNAAIRNATFATSLIEINVTAQALILQEVYRLFAARGHGVIVNINSLATKHPSPVEPVYSATKAAIGNLMRALSIGAVGTGVNLLDVHVGKFLPDGSINCADVAGIIHRMVSVEPKTCYPSEIVIRRS